MTHPQAGQRARVHPHLQLRRGARRPDGAESTTSSARSTRATSGSGSAPASSPARAGFARNPRGRPRDRGRRARRSRSPASPAEQIDLVIIATISNVLQTPSMAAVVADRVGANPAAAYDESAACAGFSYGVTQADALIRAGAAHYALVIGAEKLSRRRRSHRPHHLVPPRRRRRSRRHRPSDYPGIGAAGLGLRRLEGGCHRHERARSSTTATARPAGRPCDRTARRCSAGRCGRWRRSPSRRSRRPASTATDLAAFIPHQANMRIIDEFAKQLKLPRLRDHRARHRDDRQHVCGLDPARHPPPARRAPGAQRRARACRSASAPGSSSVHRSCACPDALECGAAALP